MGSVAILAQAILAQVTIIILARGLCPLCPLGAPLPAAGVAFAIPACVPLQPAFLPRSMEYPGWTWNAESSTWKSKTARCSWCGYMHRKGEDICKKCHSQVIYDTYYDPQYGAKGHRTP